VEGASYMRKFLTSLTIVDFVVVLAILLILAAIMMPSFMEPSGKRISTNRTHQSALSNTRY
jgi:type II secretory pathway pseudopilin PulG